MSRTETLIADLETKASKASEIEGCVALVVPRIEANSRKLKERKKRLWLAADSNEIDPAIANAKPADARDGLLAKRQAEDHECIALGKALHDDRIALLDYRVHLAGIKREIAIVETELACIRAELNARAAECYGALSANGKTATAATATV